MTAPFSGLAVKIGVDGFLPLAVSMQGKRFIGVTHGGVVCSRPALRYRRSRLVLFQVNEMGEATCRSISLST
jgi:hypothetical protein